MNNKASNLPVRLSRRIGIQELRAIAAWAALSDQNKESLWRLSLSSDRKVSVNALWSLTHLDESASSWLAKKQESLVTRLLAETDPSKKRIILQLLRRQTFNPDHPLTIRLLDYCFSKINSECEPYAVRCFSLYIAFEICRPYPELMAELEQYLALLSTQSLSPGLQSALRQIRRKIEKSKKH